MVVKGQAGGFAKQQLLNYPDAREVRHAHNRFKILMKWVEALAVAN
jgi:hypothetical protein